MKRRQLVSAAAIAVAAGGMMAFPSTTAAETPSKWPGIVTSVSRSATISAKTMAPGGEIWAGWYSLPAGKSVDLPDMPPNLGKMAVLVTALGGSATWVPHPEAPDALGMCEAGVVKIPEIHPGDWQACNYTALPGIGYQNKGSEPFVYAELVVGGPWVPGMTDSPQEFRNINGRSYTYQIAPWRFGKVEKEIMTAGAMTLTIRDVTMPPGSRIVTTDLYPTIRMIIKGELTSGTLQSGSVMDVTEIYGWVGWSPETADRQIVLSSTGDKPAEFLEWSVMPAQVDAKPITGDAGGATAVATSSAGSAEKDKPVAGAGATADAAVPDALAASPDMFKVVAETDDLRMAIVTWKPGQRDAMHRHPERVSYALTDCEKMRTHYPNGSQTEWSQGAGEAVADSPVVHFIENGGEKACQILVVKLKASH